MNQSIQNPLQNTMQKPYPAQASSKAMSEEKKDCSDFFQWTVIETINFQDFKGLEIEGITQYEDGLCEPVEEGFKPDFISLYVRYVDGGRDCIADFKPEISENDVIDFCNKLAEEKNMELSIFLFDYEE